MLKQGFGSTMRPAHAVALFLSAFMLAVPTSALSLAASPGPAGSHDRPDIVATQGIVRAAATGTNQKWKACVLDCRSRYGEICSVATEPCSKEYYRCLNDCRLKYDE